MKCRSIILALVAGFVFAAAAYAHGVRVFAEISDGQIVVRSKYSGSGSVAVRGGKVTARAPDGRVIFEGKTDDEGVCAFVPSERVDLEIVVNAGNGHVSKPFIIYADELTMFEEPTSGPSSKKPSSEKRTKFGDIEEEDIRLRDILGGLGWIVGLTGIAMYFLGRRKKDNSQDVSR